MKDHPEPSTAAVQATVGRRVSCVQMPSYIALLLFAFTVSYAAGSVYWVLRKDNEIEKYRRLEIELQNQIKERDQKLHQHRQQIEQLGKRLEILNAIQELSSADVPESDQRKIAALVFEQSETYGIDPFLLLSVMSVESTLRPWATSSAGAHGLMQIMPDTGRGLAQLARNEPRLIGVRELDEMARLDFRDIEGNIQLGTLYLTKLMVRYNNLREALFAYNLGPGLYERRKSEGGPFPTQYYSNIMATYNRLNHLRNGRQETPIPSFFAKADMETLPIRSR